MIFGSVTLGYSLGNSPAFGDFLFPNGLKTFLFLPNAFFLPASEDGFLSFELARP
jgi:hypothetical protein